LNHAVAVAMRDRAALGLALIDRLAQDGELVGYHLLHAARAALLQRLNQPSEAAAAYDRALDLTQQDSERRFLQGLLRALAS
jgi:RNA polymerase sigma-70 factor, ECF subfamily